MYREIVQSGEMAHERDWGARSSLHKASGQSNADGLPQAHGIAEEPSTGAADGRSVEVGREHEGMVGMHIEAVPICALQLKPARVQRGHCPAYIRSSS